VTSFGLWRLGAGEFRLKTLIALPVYNEGASVRGVVDGIRHYLSPHQSKIIAINDGSTDHTEDQLRLIPEIEVLSHQQNLGYGAALASAFDFAIKGGYEALVTIDADGQHDPVHLGNVLLALSHCDIASGSRYLRQHDQDTAVPGDRQRINRIITRELNDRLGLSLTDAFCGFKGYRVEGLKRLTITEAGYAMPIQLWVQAAMANLRIEEVAVPRIYLDPNRSFGAQLDQAEARLAYYRQVMEHEFAGLPNYPMPCCSGALVHSASCGVWK